IHAGVPEKAIKAALRQFDDTPSEVTWDLARSRPGRPTKVYFEASTTAEIQAAEQRLEQLLNASGFDLYP
uniref:hypothetical protein n=1 Tax=Deinococcus apachensis TaxID=309886 RepID=UPI00146F3A8D